MAHYPLDSEIDLSPRTAHKYVVSAAHRRVQPHKSIWTITASDEVECFVHSVNSNWIENNAVAWGLKKNGSGLVDLGKNHFQENLKIAKFVDKGSARLWHGYPADFVRNNQDRPGTAILLLWVELRYIEKHHFVKIRQGKLCNL